MRKFKVLVITILILLTGMYGLNQSDVKADELQAEQVRLAKKIVLSIKYVDDINKELELLKEKPVDETTDLNIDTTLEATFRKTLENLEIELVKDKMELQLVTQQLLSVGKMAKLPYLGDGSYTWPVDGYFNVSQGYGGIHKGIDINTLGAHPRIFAVQTGLVVTATNEGDGYGNKVIVYHGEGVYTLYAHLKKITAKVGQYVEEGATLGTVGNTGNSDGDHLHLQLTKTGDVVSGTIDPLKYLKK